MSKINEWKPALELLGHPSWPLCRLTLLVFVTGGFSTLREVLDELNGPIDIGECTYLDPQKTISPHIESLNLAASTILERSNEKHTAVFDLDGNPCDLLESAILIAQQQVIEKELEQINSILCAPCSCTLCCTGPGSDDLQDYFEIPLSSNEVSLFNIKRIENERTISTTACEAEKRWPFYSHAPAIFHWSNGWSLILPKDSVCPNLTMEGKCKIYGKRPYVCRKPQIFCYVVEKQKEMLVKQEKILAVTDCPYVKDLKEEIANYGRLCGLEVVFSRNKL